MNRFGYDFTGRLANNTNLGAKGIVALEAFAELCRMSKAGGPCETYSANAKAFESQVLQKIQEVFLFLYFLLELLT